MSDFLKRTRIQMSCEWAPNNPNMVADDKWNASANHWRCILRRGRKQMTIYFSQGSAITREPTASDVLDCIASDASGIENARNFEDWASEYGYEPDSRKAEKTFKVCEQQASALKRFLGEDDYTILLWGTERE